MGKSILGNFLGIKDQGNLMATKVLIVDAFSPAALNELKAEGINVVYDVTLKEQKLTDGLKEIQPDVLVVRSTKVQVPQLDAAAPNLKYVIRAGSGFDTIDTKYAKEKGVAVSNTPGLNATAVAELVWAHILQYDRSIAENITLFRQGHWNKGAYAKARGIKGTTLGIIGFGNIGRLVARRGLAFEQNVIAYDPIISAEDIAKFGVTPVDITKLAQQSDFISLHVPGDGSTKNLVNAEFLGKLKKGTLIINTSRASVIDEAALIQAVKEKGIFAALDVMSNEPADKKGEFKHPFAEVPGIFVTHHIGASTVQAEEAIGDEALKMISLYSKTKEILHQVN